MSVLCWRCGQPEWFCDMKHFWAPILVGLVWGICIGVPIGLLWYMFIRVTA